MPVRDAIPQDARRFAEIHVDAWKAAYRGLMPDAVLDAQDVSTRETMWAKHLIDRRTAAIVALDAGERVVGWCTFGPCENADAPAGAGEVYGLYLDPSVFRRGVGRELWLTALERLSGGHNRVAVWVFKDNDAGRAFYEAMGCVVDAASEKPFVRPGMELRQIRYWCDLAEAT